MGVGLQDSQVTRPAHQGMRSQCGDHLMFHKIHNFLKRERWKLRYKWKLRRGEISITGHPIHTTRKATPVRGSHKFDLERHSWFIRNMNEFVKGNSTFPTTPWKGIVLDGHGARTFNVLARCNTVREYWGAIHTMRLMKKQFPNAYITNEEAPLAIRYSGFYLFKNWKALREEMLAK